MSSTQPGQTRDTWGLACTCTAGNRYATWHDSNCNLFQLFPPATTRDVPRRTGYALEQQ